jgi:hypothetical protein
VLQICGIPAPSGAKGGGSSTTDKGKSTPRKPTVIDRASLNTSTNLKLIPFICHTEAIYIMTTELFLMQVWLLRDRLGAIRLSKYIPMKHYPKQKRCTLISWATKDLKLPDGTTVNLDGKKLRSSATKKEQQTPHAQGGKSAVHLVQDWCNELQLCLSSTKQRINQMRSRLSLRF